MKSKLEQTARIVIRDCLKIRRDEKVVIVTDRFCRSIGEALWSAAQELTDPVIAEITPRSIHGTEPPEPISRLLSFSDVFILPTESSLTHTQARIAANRAGARGATMPGITVDMMIRTLNADYRRIARLTDRVSCRLTTANKVRIKTHSGTDLELDVQGRRAYIDNGIVHEAGSFSNLPAGESYIAPRENGSNGKIVVDGSFAPIGKIRRPVIIEVVNGRIVKISGSRRYAAIFDSYGPRERTLCELGIGTNYRARITGNVLEDEKVLGTIHVAFGNNLGFGGKNNARIHLDAVLTKPSVWFDGTTIIRNGKLA